MVLCTEQASCLKHNRLSRVTDINEFVQSNQKQIQRRLRRIKQSVLLKDLLGVELLRVDAEHPTQSKSIVIKFASALVVESSFARSFHFLAYIHNE